MADFPGSVNTHTSAAAASPQGTITMAVDVSFVRTVPAILMMVETAAGLLVWSLIASIHYTFVPALGWVMFVSVTLWILTIVLFCMLLLGIHHKLSFVPWPLTILVYDGVATVLYITAFITTCVVTGSYYWFGATGHLIGAAIFACIVTGAYGASTFFSYMTWKGNGNGNAAGSTVPV
ncbi:plasmolipin [Sardina pilchardus]|uniref:plasmolipin n=1 Tax=Sardina pilchardus TaxID=27697 RepID=UPI002E115B9C